MAGDVAIYTADSRNVHSVDEINEGERLTLTLWFSRDAAHDEDANLIPHLLHWMMDCSKNLLEWKFPIVASNNMYWYSSDPGSQQTLGFNICCARIYVSGFEIYCCNEENSSPELHELLIKPLKLVRGNELFEYEFVNILHALQVVQYYFWKGAELPSTTFQGEVIKVVKLSEAEKKQISSLKSLFVKDCQKAEMVLGAMSCRDPEGSFDWLRFSAAVSELENYTCKLRRDLESNLECWRKSGIIYIA